MNKQNVSFSSRVLLIKIKRRNRGIFLLCTIKNRFLFIALCFDYSPYIFQETNEDDNRQ